MKIDAKYTDRILNTILSPFRSLEFFENDILKSSNDIDEVLDKLYPILNKEISILNLDEVELTFKKFYKEPFQSLKNAPEEKYLELLKSFSKTFLTHRDGEITFKYWNSEKDIFEAFDGVEKVLIWNSLTRIIPTDIIGILFLKDNNLSDLENIKNYSSIIKLEDKQLHSILKKGISETHLHASASTDFYNSWKNLMSLKNRYESLYEDKRLEKFKILAAIYRVLLAEFIYERDNEKENFEKYLKEKRENIYYKLEYKELKDENIDDLERVFQKLKEEVMSNSKFTVEKMEVLKNSDILRYIWREEDIEDLKTNEENIFLMKCLNYLDMTKNKDKYEDRLFLECFFNYLKVKNIFFKSMVQCNKIKGLDNFTHYFKRSTKIGVDEDSYWWGHRFRNQFRDSNLKKVEFRISPNVSFKNMKKELISIFQSYKKILESDYLDEEIDFPKIGIIYHFIKNRDQSKLQKCWYKKCENKLEHGLLNFNQNIIQYEEEKKNILKLRKIRKLSKYIVGIDGASIENNTEPWVFTSIYDGIRDSVNGYRCDNGKVIKSLGFSFHAGEDFRHIITGIRRIDETMKYFKYHSGDRIGHGIALGVNMEKWCEHHPIIMLPRVEYFENLIWMWGKSKEFILGEDFNYLEKLIFDVAKDIYGKMDGITTFNLWEMYCKKFQKFHVENISTNGYSPCLISADSNTEELGSELFERILCFKDKNKIWTPESLLKAYHCEKYLRRMNEPIQIRIKKEEIRIFEKFQKLVLKQISEDGIIVETNPTSNMAIGELKSIFEHYITNLNRLEYEKNDENYKYLMVSINSDDPSVFNSILSNEFAYIYYSLINEGYPKEIVLKWIDKIREYGMNSSFIDDKKQSLEKTIIELGEIIEALNKY